MTRRPITFICAYYRNAGQLREQQRVWSQYSPKLKPYFHVVVTDDCSPTAPALPEVRDAGIASFQLYRLLKDVPWNWLSCRNLGVEKARTEWVLLTDIDHVLPEETLRVIMDCRLKETHVYRFSRVDATLAWIKGGVKLSRLHSYKPHPNTWFMTREMFDKTGGYDERLSSLYGTDGEYRDRVYEAADAVDMLPYPMIRYPREVIPDASTDLSWLKSDGEHFTRKHNPKNDAELLRRRAERSKIPDWKPLRVTFPYEHLITIDADSRKEKEAVA